MCGIALGALNVQVENYISTGLFWGNSRIANSNTLESFASQVGDSNFSEDSLLSLTQNLKLLFNCEEATLFALDEVKRELFTKNFYQEGFPEIRLNISVKNIAGFVAATAKSVNSKNVQDSEEHSQYHKQLTYDSGWDKQLNKNTTAMIVIPLPRKKKGSSRKFVGRNMAESLR